MRTAICFFGQPRHVKKCWPSIKDNIVGPHGSDVFFHFWSSKPDKSISWCGRNEDTDWSFDKDFIVNELKPIRHIFEEQIQFDISRFPITQIPTFNFMSFTNSLMKSHLLYNIEDYDVIIHCRSDLFIQKPFRMEPVDDSRIYLEHRGTSGDQFAYGTPKVMRIFSNIWNSLDNLYQQVGYIHAETFFNRHMKNNNIELVPANIVYGIMRNPQ